MNLHAAFASRGPRARCLLARFVLAAGLAVAVLVISRASAQGPGAPPPRPPVPLLEPRPAEGPGPDMQWQLQRSPDERQPMAAFVKSLQGSDAMLEVVLGQARLLTTKRPIANERGRAVIAVGNPSVVDFEVLPNPRMIRLIGKRPGVTDLSIVTADDQAYSFEVHVTYDVSLLNAQLRQSFPDADIHVSQLRGFLVLEGQARNIAQVTAIDTALRGYVAATTGAVSATGPAAGFQAGAAMNRPGNYVPVPPLAQPPDVVRRSEVDPIGQRNQYYAEVEPGQRSAPNGMPATPEIINLMRVPGLHQVLLQVKIGELNRTALREMGADWFFLWGNGNVIGTQIAGAQQTLKGITALGTRSTAFGIFPSGSIAVVLRALRDNSVLNVLAEPNLMAMSGQQASFLAGGQFPVPVPQGGGAAGFTNTIVQFKDFGVQLSFVPYVLDEDTIRLKVAPEVSSIDQSLGQVVNNFFVPALNTRRVETTVELKQGSTLALAGLLQVDLDADTRRIPGIGDLPYLGPFFSNTTHKRVEKELLVLVTPYLIHPMGPDQVPPIPGSEVQDPTDCEFYFLNRIEGRTGRNFRATTAWDNVWHLVELMKLEQCYVQGPVGHSD
jgi:pilus assembly protein CpaC